MTEKALTGFAAWLDRWWRNPSPIDPINRSNVFDAYLAGWRDGRRAARARQASQERRRRLEEDARGQA